MLYVLLIHVSYSCFLEEVTVRSYLLCLPLGVQLDRHPRPSRWVLLSWRKGVAFEVLWLHRPRSLDWKLIIWGRGVKQPLCHINGRVNWTCRDFHHFGELLKTWSHLLSSLPLQSHRLWPLIIYSLYVYDVLCFHAIISTKVISNRWLITHLIKVDRYSLFKWANIDTRGWWWHSVI